MNTYTYAFPRYVLYLESFLNYDREHEVTSCKIPGDNGMCANRFHITGSNSVV